MPETSRSSETVKAGEPRFVEWNLLDSDELQDKYTRRIVGWKMATRMTAQLVIDVFIQARRRGLIGKGAIIHTDQGSRYAAVEYRYLLYPAGSGNQ